MKYILLAITLLSLAYAANLRTEFDDDDLFLQSQIPCLPNNDLVGNRRDDTHAETARKHLSQFADNMSEDLRKTEGRPPYPNLYPTRDTNCVGPGADPSKRDRRMRRGG